MPIEMNCPHCGAKMRVADAAIGKEGRCPNAACGKPFVIPGAPRPKDQDGTPLSLDFPEWGVRPQSSTQQAGQQPTPKTAPVSSGKILPRKSVAHRERPRSRPEVRSHPSLFWRVLLAMGLMVGFYLLAIAVAAGLLYIPYAEITYTRRLHGKLAVGCIIAALTIIWSVLPRVDRFAPPGPRLLPEHHPHLFRELARIAELTEQAMPQEVYLVPDINAWVGYRGGVMGFGSRMVMGLGLPLVGILKASGLRAVLAHEFGHYYGGDTKLAPWVYKTRVAIGRTLANLGDHWIQKPFVLYAKMFLRVTNAVSRRQEYAADALAARIAGAQSLIVGLMEIHRGGSVFGAYWESEVVPVLSSGFRPPITAGFSLFLRADEISGVASQLLKSEIEDTKVDPYDTHPPLRDRIAELEKLREDQARPGDDPSALSLFGDVDVLEQELLKELLGQDRVRAARKIRWEDALTKVYLPAWTKHAKKHASLLAGFRLSQLPELMQKPEQWMARFNGVLGEHIFEEEKREAAGGIIGPALIVVLAGRGSRVLCKVGHPVEVSCGALRIRPFSLFKEFSPDRITPEQWLAFCERSGLGDVDLGSAVQSIPGT